MKDNILILANSSSGVFGFRKELITALLEGHRVCVSTPDRGNMDDLRNLGCDVVSTQIDRRGINPVKDLGLLCRYWKLLRQEKPDLVITYTIKPNIYGGLVSRMLGIPYAVNITGLGTAFQNPGLLRSLVTFLYKIALKKAKVVFFENAGNRQVFLDAKIVPEEKPCLLSGAGVNLEHFTCAPYPDEGTTRFLFVGRVMREKGVDELFCAMERLIAEGENCTLDILGGYEEDYEATIRRHEAAGWLRYHGYVKDVRPYIEKAHCFVLPSYHEGMANTNLECAAMCRPVITSDIPGCREAVIPGESGLLCKPQDADSLYETMKHFLSLPVQTRAQMGKAGRGHMEEVFDKRKVVEQTIRELSGNREMIV